MYNLGYGHSGDIVECCLVVGKMKTVDEIGICHRGEDCGFSEEKEEALGPWRVTEVNKWLSDTR